MSDFATVACAIAGVWLIMSNRLKHSEIRPVRLSSAIFAFLLLNLMIAGVQAGYMLGLDRADRVDVALGTLLGATFGWVTDYLRAAIYEATGNHNLAKLPYPLLMLAVVPQVLITPFQDGTGSYRHGLLAYLVGFGASMVAAEVARRRAQKVTQTPSVEVVDPIRLRGFACVIVVAVAIGSVYIASTYLLSLTVEEQDRLTTFAVLGVFLGSVAESSGWYSKCPAISVVAAAVLTLTATSGFGEKLIPGSGANASRAIELAGLVVGIAITILADRGIVNPLRGRWRSGGSGAARA